MGLVCGKPVMPPVERVTCGYRNTRREASLSYVDGLTIRDMNWRGFRATASCTGALMLCTVTVALAVAAEPRPILPDGPGKDAVEASCQKCHAPNVIAAKRKTKDAWVQTVFRMRNLGAEVFDEDADTIATYLASHFGPWINVNKASSQELTDAFLLSPDEAAAFVNYRTAHGGFKTMDDLLKVPGVDVAKIRSQGDNIAFTDVPVAPEPAPAVSKKE